MWAGDLGNYLHKIKFSVRAKWWFWKLYPFFCIIGVLHWVKISPLCIVECCIVCGGEWWRKVSWGLGRGRLITKRERDLEANEEHSVDRRGSVWETWLLNQVASYFPPIMIDVDPSCGVLQVDCAMLSITRGWLWVLIHCNLKLKPADFKWFGNRVWWWMNHSK